MSNDTAEVDQRETVALSASIIPTDGLVAPSSSIDKKNEKKPEKGRRAYWWDQGKEYKFENVVLSPDKKDLLSIGEIPKSSFTVPFLKGFCSTNHLTYTNKSKTEMYNLIIDAKVAIQINDINEDGVIITSSAASFKPPNSDAISVSTKCGNKKKNKLTNPSCLSMEKGDGTMYRLISTMFLQQVRSDVITLGNDASKDALDEKKQHVHFRVFQKITPIYNDESLEELKSISWDDDEYFQIYSINSAISSNFDKLNTDEFIEVYNYLHAWFRDAKNKNTRSGTHDTFRDFVQGKHWLLYYHERLSECECDELVQLASPSLQPNVLSSTIETKGMIFS